MIIRYIEQELIIHGFEKEKRNTGYRFNRMVNNVELVCFIEENIKMYLVSTYRWNNNSIRGTYCVTLEKLRLSPDFAPVLFRKTIYNMPQFVGKEMDIHSEIIKAIDKVFS